MATPFALVALADLFLVVCFRSRLTTSYLSVIVSNLGDTPDFTQAYLPQLAVGLGLGLPLWALLLWRVRGLRPGPRRAWAAAPLAAVVLLYGAVTARQARHGERPARALLDVITHDLNSPFGVLPQGFVTWRLHAEAARAFARSEGFRFGARRDPPPDDRPELHVLVIGETSRPDRWGLNGYERDTSPRLSRTPGLLSFTDVVSQSPSTQQAVPLLLTRATADAMTDAFAERSVITAFKEVGFRTYWLSTQEVSHWAGFIHHYAAEADVRRYFERRHDGALLAPFRDIVARVRGPGDRAFVVLHTMGSHFAFENRYPPEFERFPVHGRGRAERLHNAYDNTILYTDHVLAELVAELARRDDLVSSLLFISDHGENLLDDERRLFGHAIGTAWDLPVATFFWPSQALEARHPELVRRARGHVDRPLSSRHVFHSLVDLAGLRAEGFDRRLSIFGEDLATPPRRFVIGARVDDFDALVGRDRGTSAPALRARD
ncbi:MAG: phosphoethanolamine transferase [Planctomycetes bacterium]|nr:phosphoethanolamine transferase [Planctomycetota bacterium]